MMSAVHPNGLRARLWLRAALLLGAVAPACASEAAASSTDAGPSVPAPVEGDAGHYQFPCLGEVEVTGAPSFSAIYREVFCSSGCAAAYCHGARGARAGLDMETLDTAYQSLVDVPADREPVPVGCTPDAGCAAVGCKGTGLRRVDPGHPERSLLYLKVSGSPPCGLPMPPPGGAWPSPTSVQAQQIADWIAAGAKDDRR